MPAPRPPYATDDEPNTVYYDSNATNHRRVRQPAPPDPNDRTSAYNLYDDYLYDSNDTPSANQHKQQGIVAQVAPKVVHPPSPSSPIAIAQPRPGYAAPIAALNLSQPAAPATPPSRGHALPSSPLPSSPRSTPHPLQPPSSPIVPVFATPKTPESIRFARTTPIIRGQSEETLIPKQNNEFWRRFSMVVKEESKKPYEQRQSPWLKETQSGTSCLSRWVWFIGILLLLSIAGAIGIGWYFTHNNQQNQRPASLGGSENESSSVSASSSAVISSVVPTSSGTSKHVSPTNTVARREPIPTAFVGRSYVNRMPY